MENQAQLISVAGATTAVVGAPMHMKDELRTGRAGLQVIFMDDTELTLGENASVVIDRYAYDPAKGIGDTTLQTTKGAFRFATGRITELKLKTILSPPPSPISACPAWSSGADRSTRNMAGCCSKARSPCRTRPAA